MKNKEIYESITMISLSVIVLSIVVVIETAAIYLLNGFGLNAHNVTVVSIVSFSVLALSVYVAKSLRNIRYVLRSKISECNSDVVGRMMETRNEFIDKYNEIRSFIDNSRENMKKEFGDLISKYSKYSWLTEAFEEKSCWFETSNDDKVFIVDVPWYGKDNCHKRIRFYRDENDDNKYQLYSVDLSNDDHKESLISTGQFFSDHADIYTGHRQTIVRMVDKDTEEESFVTLTRIHSNIFGMLFIDVIDDRRTDEQKAAKEPYSIDRGSLLFETPDEYNELSEEIEDFFVEVKFVRQEEEQCEST